MMWPHPKYTEFKALCKPPKTKADVIRLYIFTVIGITALVLLGFVVFVCMAKSGRTKYPSSKYKKVVKEGLLWNSVEWHER